jgi:hypothetical protein
MSRLSHFLDSLLTDGGEIVSFTLRPRFTLVISKKLWAYIITVNSLTIEMDLASETCTCGLSYPRQRTCVTQYWRIDRMMLLTRSRTSWMERQRVPNLYLGGAGFESWPGHRLSSFPHCFQADVGSNVS